MFSLSASAYDHLSRFKSFKCGVKIPIAKEIAIFLLQMESPNAQRLRRNTEKRFEYQIVFAHGYSKAMPPTWLLVVRLPQTPVPPVKDHPDRHVSMPHRRS